MACPTAPATGVWQERVATPSRWTVHAPQNPRPQPNFVPRMSSVSRSTQSSGVSGATSTVRVLPLTDSVNEDMELHITSIVEGGNQDDGQGLANTSVLRYLSPESGNKVTTVLPGPSRSATRSAAITFAPDDVPANSASSRARRRAIAFASAVATGSIASTSDGSQRGGM